MKKLFYMLIVVCLINLLFTPPINAEQPSFTLVCRGGGTMYAFYATRGPEKSYLRIYFKPSPYAGRRSAPGPGQCAWLDRTLTKDEPKKLEFYADNQYIVQLLISANGKAKIRHIKGNDLKYLIDAVSDSKIFYVHCYNDGRGYLRITKVGP